MKTRLVNPNFKEKYVLNLLRARGIHDPDEYIEPTEECLQTPSDLENIERAEKLLKKIIKTRCSPFVFKWYIYYLFKKYKRW